MPTSSENVAKLYGSIMEHENTRLATHPMEREITLRAICRRLASIPAASGAKRIADVGGGPGNLAFALADKGYHVDLVDLSPDLVQFAQAEQARRESVGAKPLLASITVGNALDPPTPPLTEASYDAVLLLGPLYHLLEETERKRAVENACRLAKPRTGLVFCAFVSIEAHLRDLAMREPARILEEKEFYKKYLADGRYQKLKSSPAGAIEIESFHTRTEDVRRFFARNFGDVAELIELRSAEGILSGGLDAKLAEAPDEVVQAWADLLFEKYSSDPEQLGCADHLLAVLCRK